VGGVTSSAFGVASGGFGVALERRRCDIQFVFPRTHSGGCVTGAERRCREHRRRARARRIRRGPRITGGAVMETLRWVKCPIKGRREAKVPES
jgi:hypothetical protein